ncbi:hypothetical protein CHUAL_002004 [Chamberlinius hualienensis]
MKLSSMTGRPRFAIKKSYSIENGYPARRRSLVGDAKFETIVNKQARESWLKETRSMSEDDDLVEEEVFLVKDAKAPQPVANRSATLIFTLKKGIQSLISTLEIIENSKGIVRHVETRSSKHVKGQLEGLIRVELPADELLQLLKSFRQKSTLQEIIILDEHQVDIKVPWFPKHISELDLCNHLMTKFEPDLDMTHPGFADVIYRQRRKEIADIAFEFKHCSEIPRVKYTPGEIKTWGTVYAQLKGLFSTHACKQHIDVIKLLEENCGYRENNIPQLQDISNFLQKKTGFTLRPAAGLMTSRDFLASLAYRVFQCTQYVRHESSPHHSPEPDCIHELLGHVPMLADQNFAQFSQELGLASLGATDEEIEKFATLYWFTIEFGLCKENNEIRAYGAGLLSSFGELKHSLSGAPELKPFDPAVASVQPYQDQDYQDVYFVTENFEEMMSKFQSWCSKNLKRPYEVLYDPYTQSVHLMENPNDLNRIVNPLKSQLQLLYSAMSKFQVV